MIQCRHSEINDDKIIAIDAAGDASVPRPPVSRDTDSETMVEDAAGECAVMCPAAGAISRMETWTTVTHRNPTARRDIYSNYAYAQGYRPCTT